VAFFFPSGSLSGSTSFLFFGWSIVLAAVRNNDSTHHGTMLRSIFSAILANHPFDCFSDSLPDPFPDQLWTQKRSHSYTHLSVGNACNTSVQFSNKQKRSDLWRSRANRGIFFLPSGSLSGSFPGPSSFHGENTLPLRKYVDFQIFSSELYQQESVVFFLLCTKLRNHRIN
jgi:hypothetical protein